MVRGLRGVTRGHHFGEMSRCQRDVRGTRKLMLEGTKGTPTVGGTPSLMGGQQNDMVTPQVERAPESHRYLCCTGNHRVSWCPQADDIRAYWGVLRVTGQ